MNPRDIADRAGAVCGFLTGVGLLATVDTTTKFNQAGVTFNSPAIEGVARLLILGMTANAGRNLAVGLHDLTKVSIDVLKAAPAKIQNAWNAVFGKAEVVALSKVVVEKPEDSGVDVSQDGKV